MAAMNATRTTHVANDDTKPAARLEQVEASPPDSPEFMQKPVPVTDVTELCSAVIAGILLEIPVRRRRDDKLNTPIGGKATHLAGVAKNDVVRRAEVERSGGPRAFASGEFLGNRAFARFSGGNRPH
jgi:hypothetical protein